MIKVFILTSGLLISLFALSAYGEENRGHHHMMGEAEHQMAAESMHGGKLGICPVLRNEASREYSYTYEGRTYYFCSPVCLEEFKKDPAKYISKIKEFKLEAFRFGFTPGKIVVKKGDIVKIYASSRDVPHGFYIKEYGIDVRLKKDEPRIIEFIAEKTGEFDILCSIYCGRGHHDMKAKLIVEE